jgi:hypothetical protein
MRIAHEHLNDVTKSLLNLRVRRRLRLRAGVAGCATAAGWANSKRNSAKVAGRRRMKYLSPRCQLFAHEHLPREAALFGSNMETLSMAIKIVLPKCRD